MSLRFFSVVALIFLTSLAAAVCQTPPVFLAALSSPFFCAFDHQNRLLVAESTGPDVRRFNLKTGRSEIVADALGEPVSLAVDGKDGDIYIVDHKSGEIKKSEGKTGIVTTLAGKADGLREPHDCALDGRGGLLIADVAAGKLWRLDIKTGKIAVWKDGFRGPRAVAVGKNGDIYVCEREGNQIQRVNSKDKRVTLFAGTGSVGNSGDGGPALLARFNGPKGICVDKRGTVYVADTENNAVRRIDADTHIITTVAAALKRPHGVAVGPDGALYIADTENNCVCRVGQ